VKGGPKKKMDRKKKTKNELPTNKKKKKRETHHFLRLRRGDERGTLLRERECAKKRDIKPRRKPNGYSQNI